MTLHQAISIGRAATRYQLLRHRGHRVTSQAHRHHLTTLHRRTMLHESLPLRFELSAVYRCLLAADANLLARNCASPRTSSKLARRINFQRTAENQFSKTVDSCISLCWQAFGSYPPERNGDRVAVVEGLHGSLAC